MAKRPNSTPAPRVPSDDHPAMDGQAPKALVRAPGETLEATNDRVWDLTLNLIHPTALYVILQLVILDHLSRSPALTPFGPLHPRSLAIYLLQFLGAWTVFYTTLLRDMGYRCAWGTILLMGATLGVASQYFLFVEPGTASISNVWAFLSVQLGLAALAWPPTMIRWRRLKRQWLEETGETSLESAGDTP